jgi:hypothetical protein
LGGGKFPRQRRPTPNERVGRLDDYTIRLHGSIGANIYRMFVIY